MNSIQSALCCWTAQQQSPPSSPVFPGGQQQQQQQSSQTCTCMHYNDDKTAIKNNAATTNSNASTIEQCRCHSMVDAKSNPILDSADQFSEKESSSHYSNITRPPPTSRPTSPSRQHQRRQSNSPSISSAFSSKSSYLRNFLARKSNSDIQSTTSSPASTRNEKPQSSSKKFSLQKFYYPRNTMNAPLPTTTSSPSSTSINSSIPASPTKVGSFSRIENRNSTGPVAPLGFEGPRSLGLIPNNPSLPSTPVSSNFPSIQRNSPGSSSPIITPSTPVRPSSESVQRDTPMPPVSVAQGPSLVLPVKPVSIPTKQGPTLNLGSPSPISSSPSLSLSPTSPPSSLSLHPFALSNLSATTYSSSSSSSTFSAVSSPNTSASNSPTEATSKPLISSPLKSEITPFPASGISPANLAALIDSGKQGPSAGSRPLILDLRLNPDFEPTSIVHSININLPTLLMRRYRRGGAVSAFAVEAFITMPSDKDLFHMIQDGWRQDLDQDGKERAHDVIVLDQDMRAGNEEFGRSPSPAWTLVSVLERGGGNCGGGSIRLWYLEGGFEAFQEWDQEEKYLTRPGGGSTFEMCVTHDSPRASRQDVEMSFSENASDSGSIHPHSMPLSLPSSATSSNFTDTKTAQAIDHAVSLTNASLGNSPRRGPPARRESLFSLNTKSLPRPASLSRSQTIGVSALNIKPTSIPPPPTPLLPLQESGNGGACGANLDRKGSWLTVPNGVSVPSISPLMSLSNNSMENTQSASSENNSLWSSRSTEGGFLSSKKSFSSSTTLLSINPGSANYGIQEEEEDGHGGSVHPFATGGNGGNHLAGLRRHHSGGAYPTSPAPGSSFFGSNSTMNGFQPDYQQSRMFADGIDSYTNNSPLYNSNKSIHVVQQQQMMYDDELAEEGGNDGEQEISCILSNFLFLGPEIATEDQALELQRLGIKRVLNMARECEDLLVVNRPGMEYYKIGVQDHIEADIGSGFMQAVEIIAASETPIYVHCKAGKSRSVTAIIAYLITQLHWSLNKAYNHVLTQRPCMCPNIGFVTELMRMEERMLGNEQKSGLARAGSLNSILSLSTAGSPLQHSHHQYAHHSLQNHHALGMAGSPKVLSTKSSMNSLAILSPPFQPRYPEESQAPF